MRATIAAAFAAAAAVVMTGAAGGARNATTFTFWRLWLGAALMLAVLAVTGRRPSRADIRASIPGGVLFGLNLVLFFSAIKATSIADVLVIGALQPALVLLVAGRLFGEHVDRAELAWIAVSVLGVVVFVLGSVLDMFIAGEEGCTMLIYGTRKPNDMCFYPRSNKIAWRGLGVMGRVESLDYWDGEERE